MSVNEIGITGIMEGCAEAGFPVTREVAEKAWSAHRAEGKQAASEVLKVAGVPMERRVVSGAEGLGGKVQTVAWGVGKIHIFVGW